MDFFQFHQVIDVKATGINIRRLREQRGLSVKDVQAFFGFEMPQAVYRWEAGINLPSVDNLYLLAGYFGVKIDDILVPRSPGGSRILPVGNGSALIYPLSGLMFLTAA